MQCAACLEVYPDVLEGCPLCPEPETDAPPTDAPVMTDNANATTQTTHAQGGSTLIEFPGVNRNRPAWRKELSERFREIQQRRAREAALEAEAELRFQLDASTPEHFGSPAGPKEGEATKQLGLVPTPDEPELNPLVAKALRRIERARQQTAPTGSRAGSARGHAATAAARVVEERQEPEVEKPQPEAEPARAPGLLVVQQKSAAEPKASAVAEPAPAPERPKAEAKVESKAEAKVEARAETKIEAKVATPAVVPQVKAATAAVEAPVAEEPAAKPQPRKISGVIDDHWLERRGAELLPQVEAQEITYDDRAPRVKRLAAGLLDLLAVAFLCAPCAAVLELTVGDWSEPRVLASLGGIVLVTMFLYNTCSVALASRTLGMKLFGLHAVDAGTARVPTTWQCARRAVVYILSLAAFGLGILYSLFDAEGRTAHDLLSGTVVVKE